MSHKPGQSERVNGPSFSGIDQPYSNNLMRYFNDHSTAKKEMKNSRVPRISVMRSSQNQQNTDTKSHQNGVKTPLGVKVKLSEKLQLFLKPSSNTESEDEDATIYSPKISDEDRFLNSSSQ
jgi:hypothetical protein